MGDTINYVNAQTVAKDRGISIEEINSSQEINYKSVITVKAKFDNGEEKLVSGTIVSETEERIISLDEYDINFIPKGILLATQNIDKPGMVGKVGTVLGKNNVNIARMDLGRNHKAQKAIMIINIDENISEDIKTELKTIMKEAYKIEPELALNADPIFDAQDYPEKGFELDSFESKTNYVVVKGKDLEDFKLTMKMVLENDNWLVDGCGIINIPINKRITR